MEEKFFNGNEINISIVLEDHEYSLKQENIQASDLSEIVSDEEEVARLIFSPHHVDTDTGEVTIAAFEDAFKRGLSVNRLKLTTENDINYSGNKKAEKDSSERNRDIKYCGYIIGNVEKIRSVIRKEKRLFAVYNTSLPENISHADVYSITDDDFILNKDDSEEPLSKKNSKKKKRKLLSDCFDLKLK